MKKRTRDVCFDAERKAAGESLLKKDPSYYLGVAPEREGRGFGVKKKVHVFV